MSRFKYNIFIVIIFLFVLGSGIYIYKSHYAPEDVDKYTKVKLWYVENDSMHCKFPDIADKFNAVEHENKQNIKVSTKRFESFDKMKNALKEADVKEAPDMIACDANHAALLKNEGKIIKLSEYFDEWNSTGFNETFLQAATYDNELIAVPYAADFEVMLVNTDFVDDSDSIKSFENLCASAKKYYEKNEKSMFSISDYARFFRTEMNGLGEKFDAVSPRNTNSEDCKYIYKILAQSAFDRGMSVSDDPISDMIKGDIPCAIVSSAELMERASEMKDNIKVYACPAMNDGKQLCTLSVETVCVCKTNTNRQNASVEFLKWFVSDDTNSKFLSGSGYIPATDTLGAIYPDSAVNRSFKLILARLNLNAVSPNVEYVKNYKDFMNVMQLVMESLS